MSGCVALITSGRVVDPEFEDAAARLRQLGYPVWRIKPVAPPPDARDRLVSEALARGYDELLLLDPAVVFDPADVALLRDHRLPFVAGTYPVPGRREFACDFDPTSHVVRFGPGGGPVEVEACGLGFAVIRRELLEAVRDKTAPDLLFAAPERSPAGPPGVPDADRAFCQRIRDGGAAVVVDTRVRLWHTGPYRYGWEDAGRAPQRFTDYTFYPAPAATRPPVGTEAGDPPADQFRKPPGPLPPGFPRLRAYVLTYPTNRDSLDLTLADIRATDWGEDPVVLTQPADWPTGYEAGAANRRRALEAAVADGVDFALILEDDVRLNRHVRKNLLANPLVARDQCDYLGLFLPDLIADPWDRAEPHLGYRLAKPRYVGPDRTWTRDRVWGSQALLVSARLMRAALGLWDEMGRSQDGRLIGVCRLFGLPLWYTSPCLAEHAPLRSVHNTPTAYAPDFDPDFRLTIGPGFQPPDGVPGAPTRAEGGLLWRTAAGRRVLVTETGSGGAVICSAQQGRAVVSVSPGNQDEVAEWTRRFGLADRVEFRPDETWLPDEVEADRFGLVVVDGRQEPAALRRVIEPALGVLEPGGAVGVLGYPDPAWPDIRTVVDEYARQLGWRRVAQADYLGVFVTPRDGP